jgi:hypothetical protein
MSAFGTPIVFVIFNRPAETRRVFARLREVRPRRLHVIADGPRADRPEDVAHCAETRAVVEEMLDWPCEVTRDFAPENLGCGRRLATGLTRAFAELGEAIVIEDDVLPHPDFFPFGAAMLARYRDEARVHAINGFNPLERYAPRRGRFVPSVFNSIWGWASWQRAWRDYRFEMAEWDDPAVRAAIERFVRLPLIAQHLAQHVEAIRRGHLDTWDFQWWLAQLRAERVSLVSSVNFIENVGFNSAGTHTAEPLPFLRGLRTHPAAPATRERASDAPDRVFDRLYIDAVLTASPAKVAAVRWAAGAALTHPLIARALR